MDDRQVGYDPQQFDNSRLLVSRWDTEIAKIWSFQYAVEDLKAVLFHCSASAPLSTAFVGTNFAACE